uniref:Uncharacterized protein n=1 Tax=Ditylum brightwellii TaxID=49249 RepID=A0A7S4R932_9STRA|mmetsp:Transcript_21924/g.28903  ORF Transcript_21924/g.28903 Transcript_21924/m.28903 type:complete len:621 (+) Transcript_21924:130-1992(+)
MTEKVRKSSAWRSFAKKGRSVIDIETTTSTNDANIVGNKNEKDISPNESTRQEDSSACSSSSLRRKKGLLRRLSSKMKHSKKKQEDANIISKSIVIAESKRNEHTESNAPSELNVEQQETEEKECVEHPSLLDDTIANDVPNSICTKESMQQNGEQHGMKEEKEESIEHDRIKQEEQTNEDAPFTNPGSPQCSLSSSSSSSAETNSPSSSSSSSSSSSLSLYSPPSSPPSSPPLEDVRNNKQQNNSDNNENSIDLTLPPPITRTSSIQSDIPATPLTPILHPKPPTKSIIRINKNNNTSPPKERGRKSVKFADEEGNPISSSRTISPTRHSTSTSQSSSSSNKTRLIVLLMCPTTKQFELISLYHNPTTRTELNTILSQIKSKATLQLQNQRFVGLCLPDKGQEMINLLSVDDYGLHHNDIVIAIPRGLNGRDCAELARPILKDRRLIQLVQRGKRRRARSSTTSLPSTMEEEKMFIEEEDEEEVFFDTSTTLESTPVSRDLSVVQACHVKQQQQRRAIAIFIFTILTFALLLVTTISQPSSSTSSSSSSSQTLKQSTNKTQSSSLTNTNTAQPPPPTTQDKITIEMISSRVNVEIEEEENGLCMVETIHLDYLLGQDDG